MRNVAIGLCCVAAMSVVGCQGSDDGDSKSGKTTTLRLSAQDDGSFESCDSNGECQSLPNPNACDTLIIEIDNVSGRTCETCLGADDSVIYATCESPSVNCQVITLPEPDCMLCAYVNGAIVYSTCVVPPNDEITCYDIYSSATGAAEPGSSNAPDSSNSAGSPGSDPSAPSDPTVPPPFPGERCTVCYDSLGNLVKSDCEDHCADVACTMQACEAGYEPVYLDGACCPVCRPISECTMVACPMMACGPGYETIYVDGECCPVCKPIDDGQCDSDDDCGPGGVCIRYASMDSNMACLPPPCEDPAGCPDVPVDCGGSSGGFCSYLDCTMVLCAMMECPPDTYFQPDPSAGCCAGSCVPVEQKCYSSGQCPSGQHCTVEDGVCNSDCPPGMLCPDVCSGTCVGTDDVECPATECGPQMGMPNYECTDGSWGGPTGRCLRNADGSCGWEVRQCQGTSLPTE